MLIRYSFFFAFFLGMMSCAKSFEDGGVNKFSDIVVTKISDFQDRRGGDSLANYLQHQNAVYRRQAALAFGSLQDSTYLGSLTEIINDPDSAVRKAIVFALGQTQSNASEKILLEVCGKEKNKFVLCEAIEAYGKVATVWKLDIQPNDSLTSAALAWSFYRMAVRGLSDTTLNKKCAELLNSFYNKTTRLGATHYFARGAKDFEKYQNQLIRVTMQDPSSEVRMAAVLSLRKILSDSSLKTCIEVSSTDKDERVRVNAVRSLQAFEFDKTKDKLTEALQDSSVQVGIAASEVIKASITKAYWTDISTIARRIKNWRAQANLLEAALSVSDHKELAEEIQSVYIRSSNPYQKAALLTALQHSLMSFDFVRDKLFVSKEPVIKLSAAASLTAMNYRKNFESSFRPTFATIYQHAIEDGDVAVIGIIAEALADSILQYKSIIKDISFLHHAKKKLSLPKDFEGLVTLEKAIAHFSGTQINSQLPSNPFNHPIDWALVKKIPRDQKAIIKTSKGNITIRLLVEDAPGSVVNFMSLALTNYYNDKYIHRVVPNFVVQAGCNRGDGWGSEDYSIRSEFSCRRFKTGSLGMASAGKDTEGTQWFITHSPTPHLDGRYTLFAEVEEGMAIVNHLEVGDKVQSVDIINFKPL